MWASEEEGAHPTPSQRKNRKRLLFRLPRGPGPPPAPSKALTRPYPCLQVTLYYNRIKVYLAPLLAYFSPILAYLRLPAGFDHFCVLLANRRAWQAKNKKVGGRGNQTVKLS